MRDDRKSADVAREVIAGTISVPMSELVDELVVGKDDVVMVIRAMGIRYNRNFPAPLHVLTVGELLAYIDGLQIDNF